MPIILDRHGKLAIFPKQGYIDMLGPGMFADIDQRLLGHPIKIDCHFVQAGSAKWHPETGRAALPPAF